jgi:hypothetical protein
MGILNSADQCLKGWLVGSNAARFDLHDQTGRFKAEATTPGDDIDALVRAGRRDADDIALGLKDFCDKSRKIMPGESAGDAALDLVPRDLIEIDLRFLCGRRFG